MSWDLVDWSIIGPAMAAGLLVLSTHVPLGQVVLQRGIIFIDLAIAQVAALPVRLAPTTSCRERSRNTPAPTMATSRPICRASSQTGQPLANRKSPFR